MCDQHEFHFDEDRAFADQLIATLLATPDHPISDPRAPEKPGVYTLYWKQAATPVFVGLATEHVGIASSLGQHLEKVSGRVGIAPPQVTCRYLVIARAWEAMRAFDALVKRYEPAWNRISGFDTRVPVGEWLTRGRN